MITKIGYQPRATFGMMSPGGGERPIENQIYDGIMQAIKGDSFAPLHTKNALAINMAHAIDSKIIPLLEGSDLSCKELAARLKQVRLAASRSHFRA